MAATSTAGPAPSTDYEVKDGAIVCKPGQGGTLFTTRQYRDFVVRLEFKLPPAGNNGLAIRYPGTGDSAYVGMTELQVLDDTDPKYAALDPRQAHGSAYGMVAAKKGHLKPVGEWNEEEVTVRGSTISVVLNGTEILDADLAKVTTFLDDKPHPGKDRRKATSGSPATTSRSRSAISGSASCPDGCLPSLRRASRGPDDHRSARPLDRHRRSAAAQLVRAAPALRAAHDPRDRERRRASSASARRTAATPSRRSSPRCATA